MGRRRQAANDRVSEPACEPFEMEALAFNRGTRALLRTRRPTPPTVGMFENNLRLDRLRSGREKAHDQQHAHTPVYAVTGSAFPACVYARCCVSMRPAPPSDRYGADAQLAPQPKRPVGKAFASRSSMRPMSLPSSATRPLKYALSHQQDRRANVPVQASREQLRMHIAPIGRQSNPRSAEARSCCRHQLEQALSVSRPFVH